MCDDERECARISAAIFDVRFERMFFSACVSGSVECACKGFVI